jgi:hypothetical protein
LPIKLKCLKGIKIKKKSREPTKRAFKHEWDNEFIG